MTEQPKVALIGCGVVGKATAKLFKIEECYEEQLTLKEIEGLKDHTYIFLCLPTPTVDGEQDLQLINNYVRDIASYSKDPTIIIRSTVLPGTAKRLHAEHGLKIVSFPEFLSEDTAYEDTKNPDFLLLGFDGGVKESLLLYLQGHYRKKYLNITDTVTAELTKYATNAFFVTKVVFANEIYDYAHEVGADYNMIQAMMYKNRYIGSNHLGVNHKGYRGAGGKCLMKDMDAFTYATKAGLFRFVNGENLRILRANGTS